ncbi:phosphoribosylformylglycinamidine synthase I (FGAM synthase I) [Legionella beliardensis]|uniref:Phosphoribosylformylglycinamidine synthase I (FGAM synthase I) n=1 Tax=Legionella beliardensis TaxID=91822 RepID=A0A378I1W0_9GAMM|nr:phosphoribosylformylglycinamidine synthase I [Legionella beliardensis]STX28700.1 phosphoribosylformylglycinamidine synthase I (FGAM synthase I) [Legionella beliardensis]
MIRIGLIQFPGSNCERETALAIKRAGMQPVEFLWNEPISKLKEMEGYVLIGGFSYEDRSRAGIIAALDPVMREIKIQSDAGKPVLGICNGAQILLEAGLVPGLTDSNNKIALTENKRVKDGKILGIGFYNAWVNVCLTKHYQKNNAFTRYLSENDTIHLPVAHAEGRFIMPVEFYQELKQQGLNLLQYCDEQGEIIDNFPINPNGSIDNIAAISNVAGNVMAMMPHPERTTNGDVFFHSMRDFIISTPLAHKLVAKPIQRNVAKPPPFAPTIEHTQCVVKLIITDNQALTVQKTLQKLGIPVTVNRFVHWEISHDSAAILEQIKKSGVLYCDRKEHEVSLPMAATDADYFCLVRAKEDLVGQRAKQTLTEHYSISEVKSIKHSILWHFSSDYGNIDSLMDEILLTNIIGNQYAHEFFSYNR